VSESIEPEASVCFDSVLTTRPLELFCCRREASLATYIAVFEASELSIELRRLAATIQAPIKAQRTLWLTYPQYDQE
jgi:hypothetical protein